MMARSGKLRIYMMTGFPVRARAHNARSLLDAGFEVVGGGLPARRFEASPTEPSRAREPGASPAAALEN